MAITPRQYNERREALMKLFNAVAEYPELPWETRKRFICSSEKLQTNSFEIVLVGEFQGGKSTTFNTICDGRPISPMGSGIKTSACRITARNIADPNEPERAVVTWKTDAELLLTMRDILLRNLPEEDVARLDVAEKSGEQGISFDDPRDLQLMRDCLAKEWEIYKKRPAAYDLEQKGKLDLLYIASLILEFRSDPTIVRQRAETREIPIDKVAEYVVFPSDWVVRWSQGDPKAFAVEEVMLAFVGKVDCYLHSPNLKRLGCVIVDCPGLFAGPWDTQVATEAMTSADAILYLFRGDKQIGDQELRALKMIQTLKQLHKLWFAINARMAKEHLQAKIRPVDAATINNSVGKSEAGGEGLCVESDDIFIFNAFLSNRAKTRDFIEPQSAEAKEWKKSVRKALGTYLDLDVEDDAERLAALLENLEDLLNESGYNELMDACESTVVAKKARSLLLDSGATPVSAALSELEAELALREENAKKKASEVSAELAAAREALKKFQRRSQEIIEQELSDESLVSTLGANMISEVYEQNMPRLAEALMARVETMMNDGPTQRRYIGSFIKKRVKKVFSADAPSETECDEFSQTLKANVEEAMREVCVPATQGWIANIKQKRNKVYNATLGQKMRTIEMLLQQEWNDMLVKAPKEVGKYLGGLKIAFTPEAIVENVDIFGGTGLTGTVESAMLKQFAGMIGSTVVSVFAGATAAVLATLILTAILAAPLAFAAAIVTAIITTGGLDEAIREKISAMVRNALAEKLEPQLAQAMSKGEVKAKLRECGEDAARQIITAHKEAYKKDLKTQKDKFEARVKKLEADRSRSLEELEKIAAEAKRIREEVAELRQPLDEFVAETSVYFADATL